MIKMGPRLFIISITILLLVSAKTGPPDCIKNVHMMNRIKTLELDCREDETEIEVIRELIRTCQNKAEKDKLKDALIIKLTELNAKRRRIIGYIASYKVKDTK